MRGLCEAFPAVGHLFIDFAQPPNENTMSSLQSIHLESLAASIVLKLPNLDFVGIRNGEQACFWEVERASGSSPSFLNSAMTYEEGRNVLEDMGMVSEDPYAHA